MRKVRQLGALALVVWLGFGCDTEAPLGATASLDARSRGASSSQGDPSACHQVKGTVVDEGSVVPTAGEVITSGPVEGDVSGTLTLIRDVDARNERGDGAVSAHYKEVVLETNELGTFTGTADGTFNLGLGAKGKRSNRAQIHVDFTGPDERHGSMTLRGPFDFSDFPPILRAELTYSGRLCPGGA